MNILRNILCVIGFVCDLSANAQTVDFSVVSVNEESGTSFMKITNDNDYVCMPIVKRSARGCSWLSNRILGISPDGEDIAYLSFRNNTTNIFIKNRIKQGVSVQRTNRQNIIDFSYSPNGKYICFSEKNGKTNQIFQTDSKAGYICRLITSSNIDYSPIYSYDMTQIFFARQEIKSTSIWSYNIKNNFVSSFASGMNPYPIKENVSSLLCARPNAKGRGEIWKINYETGTEECIMSDPVRSFTTPSVSPDGNWILFVGSNGLNNGNSTYYNTDIFVCRMDGSNFAQLTYHAADDLSPIWSLNGEYIYFISQRGSQNGTANIWRMKFNY